MCSSSTNNEISHQILTALPWGIYYLVATHQKKSWPKLYHNGTLKHLFYSCHVSCQCELVSPTNLLYYHFQYSITSTKKQIIPSKLRWSWSNRFCVFMWLMILYQILPRTNPSGHLIKTNVPVKGSFYNDLTFWTMWMLRVFQSHGKALKTYTYYFVTNSLDIKK